LIVGLLTLGGCGMFAQSPPPKFEKGKTTRATLAELNLEPIRVEPSAAPVLSIQQMRDEYAALLPLLGNSTQQQQVAFRLADLEMQIAESAQETGVPPNRLANSADSNKQRAPIGSGYFVDAIKGYQNVLQQQAAQYEKLAWDQRQLQAVQLLRSSEMSKGANKQLTVAERQAQRDLIAEQQRELARSQLKYMDAMYQLAKAFDLEGLKRQSIEVTKRFITTFDIANTPITDYHIELYFRLGEYHFTNTDYPAAQANYEKVLRLSKQQSKTVTNGFYGIAAYMLGWTHFKQDAYQKALQAFTAMLDQSLAQNTYAMTYTSVDDLPKGEQRLVRDSLRIMALLFSYQGNADAILAFYRDNGERAYSSLLFAELAQQHLNESRFKDSADTALAFAQAYPTHQRAVEFFVRHIDAYILADFPLFVLDGKRKFIAAYGIDGPFFISLQSFQGTQAAPYLEQYIKELAQTEHSLAQSLLTAVNSRADEGQPAFAQGLSQQFSGDSANQAQQNDFAFMTPTQLSTLSQEAFEQAADYYSQFIRTFDLHPDVAQMRFYRAEALFSARNFKDAISEFETYAYLENDNPFAADAAHAALLSYQALLHDQHGSQSSDARGPNQALTATVDGARQQLSSQQESSQISFVQTFSSDPRTVSVVLPLMQKVFKQGRYVESADWANWLIQASDKSLYSATNIGAQAHKGIHIVPRETLVSARLVIAHSYFEMGDFANAQSAYQALILQLPALDQRIPDLQDKFAASLFKQAEQSLLDAQVTPQVLASSASLSAAQINALQANTQFLVKLISETPDVSFRKAAQFDLSTYLIRLQNYAEALPYLLDFQTRFSRDPLQASIPDKLLVVYEALEKWPQAADLLMAQWQQGPQTELGQEALYVAALYYQKANQSLNARDAFRLYANTYTLPLDTVNEARVKLTDYYQQNNNQRNYRFWLNKIILADKAAGQQRTQRSRYLAAQSSMVFAQDADATFKRIKLTLPLNKSLNDKQAALKSAIARYDEVMAYQVAEFTTQANYALANLYLRLADDLMNSDRPRGLTPLELSQYELLLEEQAFPFEETSISLHENNIQRMQNGLFDQAIKDSLARLSELLPVRYQKPLVTEALTFDDF